MTRWKPSPTIGAARASPAISTPSPKNPPISTASSVSTPAPAAATTTATITPAPSKWWPPRQKASTSYLQRQLRVGYNNAARLIERMEQDGFVSKPDHVGRREVLIDESGARR